MDQERSQFCYASEDDSMSRITFEEAKKLARKRMLRDEVVGGLNLIREDISVIDESDLDLILADAIHYVKGETITPEMAKRIAEIQTPNRLNQDAYVNDFKVEGVIDPEPTTKKEQVIDALTQALRSIQNGSVCISKVNAELAVEALRGEE